MALNRAPAHVRKARLLFGPATLSWMSQTGSDHSAIADQPSCLGTS